MAKTRKATIKDRNRLFGLTERVRKGECFAISGGDAGIVRAARELHDEGIIALHEIVGAAGVVLRVERSF
jgi:hypothetical protein